MLEHDPVAGHQAGSAGSEDLPEREVPRHDGEDDAERLVRHVAGERLGRDRRIGQVLACVLGVVLAGERALGDLRLRLGDRLAHLRGDEGCVALDPAAKELSDPPHRHGALLDAHRPPRALGSRDSGDGVVHLVVGPLLELSEDLLRGRVDGGDHVRWILRPVLGRDVRAHALHRPLSLVNDDLFDAHADHDTRLPGVAVGISVVADRQGANACLTSLEIGVELHGAAHGDPGQAILDQEADAWICLQLSILQAPNHRVHDDDVGLIRIDVEPHDGLARRTIGAVDGHDRIAQV
jgi:hypothetical protein